jgi:hypothetical protein
MIIVANTENRSTVIASPTMVKPPREDNLFHCVAVATKATRAVAIVRTGLP